MSYRTAQPTAQKASLRDARYRPTPWTRKVRRAWPESNLEDRRVLLGLLIVLSALAVVMGIYLASPKAMAFEVICVIAPMTWGILRNITNEGLRNITARAVLRRERRSYGRYAGTCRTCGSPSCAGSVGRYSWFDRLTRGAR